MKKTAFENMEEDHQLLMTLSENDLPRLRIYEWEKPSFTHGYFSKPEMFLDLDLLASEGFDWARRPTGGGVLFHTHDVAFSVLIPSGNPLLSSNTLTNYELINSMVKEAVSPFVKVNETSLLTCCEGESTFCMAKPTIFDVMIEGKKVGGAAQRRSKTGLLHQGTICLGLPDFDYLAPFFKEKHILEMMKQVSYPLQIPREKIIEGLSGSFSKMFYCK